MNSKKKSPNVCIVGAGFAGVCAAVQLQRLLNIRSFTIYDNQKEVGGVWVANRYPGCGNDSPSISYTYSFELKGDFSKSFVSSEETCTYLRDVCIKYDLYPRMKLETSVKNLVWDDTLKVWNVTIASKNNENKEETLNYDIVILGTGHFHKPHYPAEFLEFKGPLVHTAEWDPTIDLENKDVAVIGGGASTIQLIPNIVEKVKNLYSYQRQPIWNFPFLRPEFDIPRPAQFALSYLPFILKFLRVIIFLMFEMFWVFYKSDWNVGKKVENLLVRQMGKQIHDEKLVQDLTPNYALGCKRIGLHNDYFWAMKQPNVKLFTDPISKVTRNSILNKDGKKTKIDVLILATGFEVQNFFAPLQITGRNGENILENWKNSEPSTYFCVVSNSMPNLFMLNGPNSDSGHVSAPTMIEMQVKFAFRILSEMMKRKARSFCVRSDAEEKFMRDLKCWSKNRVQGTGNCGSYYKNSKNKVTSLWPLTGTYYWLKTRFVKFSNFEFC